MPVSALPHFAGYEITCRRRDPICPGCGHETVPGETVRWIPAQCSQAGDQGAWVCQACADRAGQGELINTELVPRMEETWGVVLWVPPWMCPEDKRFTPARVRELWPGYFTEKEKAGALSEPGKALSETGDLLSESGKPSTENVRTSPPEAKASTEKEPEPALKRTFIRTELFRPEPQFESSKPLTQGQLFGAY